MGAATGGPVPADAVRPAAAGGQPARIGPNAITRVAEALREAGGDGLVVRVFEAAGLGGYLAAMPASMVPESDVVQLHQVLRAELGPTQARAIAREAGRRTADYLLAHRIPRPVQWLLHALPARPAARILVSAIERNSWTFCGSAGLSADAGPPTRFELVDCALARGARSDAPVCDFYTGTFERLFRVLVQRDTTAREVACAAAGARACVFELRW
jgi:divinyl protochlorophyllide a 8-vinyl-reductase